MPSSAQHTPGPWKAYWFCDNERTGVGHWSFTGGRGDLGILPRCSRDNAEREANARLIAAAPEMLEALKDLLYVAEEEGLEHAWRPAVEAARKALDKAHTAL